MKKYLWCLTFFFTILGTGCQFHYIENPGPQFSSTINQSKANNTFICAYTSISNKINGVRVDTIFAERKYSSDGGYFSHYKIDTNNSQLIILARDYLVRNGKGFGIDWSIKGFEPYSGKMTYKDYKLRSLPDTLVFDIDSMSRSHLTKPIAKLTLYKVK